MYGRSEISAQQCRNCQAQPGAFFVLRTLKRCYIGKNVLASEKTRFLKTCYEGAKIILQTRDITDIAKEIVF